MKAVLQSIRKIITATIKKNTGICINKCAPDQLRTSLIDFFENDVVRSSSDIQRQFTEASSEEEINQQMVDILAIFLDLARETLVNIQA